MGKLHRFALGEGNATGLYKDFSKTEYIDHIYASHDWLPGHSVALRKPRSPWDGIGKVIEPSDHVPVTAELQSK